MHALSQRDPPIPTLYVKSTGRNVDSDDIRNIFKKARENTPCLLVLEDIDSLVNDDLKSFFLNEIDGLEGNDGIMVIGSTNYCKPTFSEPLASKGNAFHTTLSRKLSDIKDQLVARSEAKVERGSPPALY